MFIVFGGGAAVTVWWGWLHSLVESFTLDRIFRMFFYFLFVPFLFSLHLSNAFEYNGVFSSIKLHWAKLKYKVLLKQLRLYSRKLYSNDVKRLKNPTMKVSSYILFTINFIYMFRSYWAKWWREQKKRNQTKRRRTIKKWNQINRYKVSVDETSFVTT